MAANPAPLRPSSTVERLRNWYESLKAGLSDAIKQAREHWRRESSASADAAGWTETEQQSAGIELPVQEPQPEAPAPSLAQESDEEREKYRRLVMEEEGEPAILDEIVRTPDGALKWRPISENELTEAQRLALEDAKAELNEIDEQKPDGPTLG